jgi:hypothetical protein
MKKLLSGLALLTSVSTFASDIGNCNIHAISDISSQDSTLQRVFNFSRKEASLTYCLEEFNRDIEYLKSCRLIVGGKIHNIELQFTISGRTVSTVEPLNIICN